MPRPVPPADDRAGLSPFEVATEVRMDATTHLAALAGDASMCAIGRSGRSFPAAKYHEGRQAAAGQARRVLRPESTSAGERTLAGLTSQWQLMLQDADAKGPDWVAYASGGLDALAEISKPPG